MTKSIPAAKIMLNPLGSEAWQTMAPQSRIRDREYVLTTLYRSNFPHAFPPPLFSIEACNEIRDVGIRLAELIGSVPMRRFGDDIGAWLSYLRIPTVDRGLISTALADQRLSKIAREFIRPDLILTANGLCAVEVNVSAPMGGINTHDPYVSTIRNSAFAASLAERNIVLDAPDMTAVWLDAFRSCLRREADDGVVFEAVAHHGDIDSGRRFFVDMLKHAGYEVESGCVTDLDVNENGVTYHGRRITTIFTMYTWLETRRYLNPSLTRALIDLDGRGLLDFIGSPASAAYDSKVNLALLCDPLTRRVLTTDEIAFVDQYVPETFILNDQNLPRALSEQSRLVCKPASEYGGKRILFGDEMSVEDWRTALGVLAKDNDASYVCQRRLQPAVAYHDDDCGPVEVCFGPMIFGQRYAGTFVRHAPSQLASVINMAHGAQAFAMMSGVSRRQ